MFLSEFLRICHYSIGGMTMIGSMVVPLSNFVRSDGDFADLKLHPTTPTSRAISPPFPPNSFIPKGRYFPLVL